MRETPINRRLLAATTVKARAGMAALRKLFPDFLASSAASIAGGFAQNVDERAKATLKRKDPSGGTTGRVKPYGRLGWMGARAEYSQWGGITAPTQHKSQQGPRTFKTARGFFNSFEGGFYCAAG